MWRINIPEISGTLVGPATVASRTPGIFMLEDRNDLGVLWDSRDPSNVESGALFSRPPPGDAVMTV